MKPTASEAQRLGLSKNAIHRICNHFGVCAHLSRENKIENTLEHVTEFLNKSPMLRTNRLLSTEDVRLIITRYASDRFTIEHNLVIRKEESTCFH